MTFIDLERAVSVLLSTHSHMSREPQTRAGMPSEFIIETHRFLRWDIRVSRKNLGGDTDDFAFDANFFDADYNAAVSTGFARVRSTHM